MTSLWINLIRNCASAVCLATQQTYLNCPLQQFFTPSFLFDCFEIHTFFFCAFLATISQFPLLTSLFSPQSIKERNSSVLCPQSSFYPLPHLLYSSNLQIIPSTLNHPVTSIPTCYAMAYLSSPLVIKWASLVAQTLKNLPAMQETQVGSLGQEDPWQEGMATHSSFLARKIPWTEELGGLRSMGSQRGRHD